MRLACSTGSTKTFPSPILPVLAAPTTAATAFSTMSSASTTSTFTLGRKSTVYTVDFLPKVKVEVVLADDMVEKAVAAVVGAAKTGKIGDGKVFVLPVEHASRIRTEEIGEKAV